MTNKVNDIRVDNTLLEKTMDNQGCAYAFANVFQRLDVIQLPNSLYTQGN